MITSGGNLSLFGRTALSNLGGSRAGLKPVLDPVESTGPSRDATSSEYRELQDLKQPGREVRRHGQAHLAAGGSQAAQTEAQQPVPGRHARDALSAYRGAADSLSEAPLASIDLIA